MALDLWKYWRRRKGISKQCVYRTAATQHQVRVLIQSERPRRWDFNQQHSRFRTINGFNQISVTEQILLCQVINLSFFWEGAVVNIISSPLLVGLSQWESGTWDFMQQTSHIRKARELFSKSSSWAESWLSMLQTQGKYSSKVSPVDRDTCRVET